MIGESECVGAEELEGDAAWWEIYRESFPDEEREPREVILTSLRRRVGLAFRARRDGATVGIATTHLLLNPAAVFLVYLATASEKRGEGVGGRLLEFAWERSAARLHQPLGMIWEIDADEGRVRFFERHGGVVLSRRYLQPPVNGVEPVPMQLMFRPAKGMAAPDAAGIDSLVQAMYVEKYAAVNGIYMK